MAATGSASSNRLFVVAAGAPLLPSAPQLRQSTVLRKTESSNPLEHPAHLPPDNAVSTSSNPPRAFLNALGPPTRSLVAPLKPVLITSSKATTTYNAQTPGIHAQKPSMLTNDNLTLNVLARAAAAVGSQLSGHCLSVKSPAAKQQFRMPEPPVQYCMPKSGVPYTTFALQSRDVYTNLTHEI